MATPYLRVNSCLEDKLTGEVYVLLEATNPESTVLKVVPFQYWSRHALICALEDTLGRSESRYSQSFEDMRKEKMCYEKMVNVTEVLPKDQNGFCVGGWPTK